MNDSPFSELPPDISGAEPVSRVEEEEEEDVVEADRHLWVPYLLGAVGMILVIGLLGLLIVLYF